MIHVFISGTILRPRIRPALQLLPGLRPEDGEVCGAGPSRNQAWEKSSLCLCDNDPLGSVDPLGLDGSGYLHFYKDGVWTQDTTVKADLGQIVVIYVKNVNVLGTTIWIEPNHGETQKTILFPQQRTEFRFDRFGCEPMYWKFDVTTESDAFVVFYEIRSSWVPGMPPNQ